MGERTSKLIFHLLVAVFFLVSWQGVLSMGNKLRSMGKAQSRLVTRFLTNWNFFIQTVLFIGYLLYDILEVIGLDGRLAKKMKRIIDFYFYAINGPTSIFVAAVFWTMCYYDKLLIFPVGLEKFIPDWVNHSIHSVIVVNVVIQAYYNKVSQFNVKKAVVAYTAFFLFYFICIYGTYYETNLWIYPFLGKVVEPYRMLGLLALFVFSSLINVSFYFCNKWYCNRCMQTTPPVKPQRSGYRKKQK